MYKIISYCLFFCVVFTTACNDEGVDIPSFDVNTSKSDCIAGTYMSFKISGNPDLLTFYSGEIGKRYEYSSRTTANGKPILSFNSAMANGTQQGSITLLISQDFAGMGMNDSTTTVKNIAAAKWIDITGKAVWATNSTNKASGDIDLSEFVNRPVYIAFKYKGFAGSNQNKWTISSLVVKNNLPDGTSYVIANHTTSAIANYGVSKTISPGWFGRNTINQYKWVIGSSNFVITGATNGTSALESESWCLSGPIDLTHVSPDNGIAIKNMSSSVNEYNYQYNTVGKYNATFVGGTNSIYGSAKVVKQVEITVRSAN